MTIVILGLAAGHARWPIAGQAQEVVTIEARCPAGSWSLEEELGFGSEAEVGLRGPAQAVYRRPNGGVALHQNGRVHLFARDGRLEYSFGRRGQGPGEFRNVQIIRFRVDERIETYDSPQLRRTVFRGPPGFEVESTGSIPFGFSFTGTLFHPDGRIVANEDLRTPERVGWPIHLVQSDGAVIRSFGKEPRERRLGVAFPLRRSLAWAGPRHDAVWSGHWRQYRIERWSLEGRLLQTIRRDVPWFRPWDVDPPLSPSTPPPPSIRDLRELDGGLLAVLLRVPTRDPGQGMVLQNGEWQVIRPDKVSQGRLEVLDAARRCVAASIDIAGYPLRFVDDGAIAIYRESDETGLPSIRLLRLQRR